MNVAPCTKDGIWLEPATVRAPPGMVVAYYPQWPVVFGLLRARADTAADVPHMTEHVGSTAVPGLTHLIADHGRRRLFHVGGPPNSPDAIQRRLALDYALRGNPQCQLIGSAQGIFSIASGGQAAEELLARHRAALPDAVVCANDQMAIGVLRALTVLGSPVPAVLVHGDLHGNNQVWDRGELRLVVDFENIGAAEPEYELRGFPGPGMGPGLELLTAIMRRYQQVTGRQLSPARVMAWHLRHALGDVLWRSEAGLPLADHRTPPQSVEDLAARFIALSITPEASSAASQR